MATRLFTQLQFFDLFGDGSSSTFSVNVKLALNAKGINAPPTSVYSVGNLPAGLHFVSASISEYVVTVTLDAPIPAGDNAGQPVLNLVI